MEKREAVGREDRVLNNNRLPVYSIEATDHPKIAKRLLTPYV